MSDSKNIPSPPPDDFSKTTPNINLPKDNSPQNAWEKTNHKFPAQPPSDDWGNTVANIRPIEADDQDYNKTYFPGSQKSAQTPDWGMTQANIDLSETDFGGKQDTSGSGPRQEDLGEGNYGATTPYFRLPDAERVKYQNLPPTPTEKAAQEKKEQKEKGGIPLWVWVSGGLFSMFFFALAVLLVVYFFFIPPEGYEATVIDAPPGSTIRVDKAPWGVSVGEDGKIKLPVLREGTTKVIEIIHPTHTCQPTTVISNNGVVSPDPIKALCTPNKPTIVVGECINFKRGDENKAEGCYNAALAALPDPFTAEDLVKALNIFIINFETNKFDIPLVRLAALQRGADYIKKLSPTVVLEIGGHTDNVGGDVPNQKLSENRANAVRNKLVEYGVKPEVLQTKGYGKTSPKTTNNTDDEKFQNRRIEYLVLKR